MRKGGEQHAYHAKHHNARYDKLTLCSFGISAPCCLASHTDDACPEAFMIDGYLATKHHNFSDKVSVARVAVPPAIQLQLQALGSVLGIQGYLTHESLACAVLICHLHQPGYRSI